MNQCTNKVGKAAKEEVVPFQHLEAGKNSKHHPMSSQPKPKGHSAIPWCLYTSNTVSRLLLCQIFYVWIARSSCFWDPLFDGTTQRTWRGRQGSLTHSHAFGLYIHTTSQSEAQAPPPLAVTCPWFSYDAWACLPVAAEAITLLPTACGRRCRENPSYCDCEKNKGTLVAQAASLREVATFYSPRSHLRSRVLGSTLLIISPRRAPDQSMRTRRAEQHRRCIPGARAAPQLQETDF